MVQVIIVSQNFISMKYYSKSIILGTRSFFIEKISISKCEDLEEQPLLM